MSTPTVKASIVLTDHAGAPLVGATITAQLNRDEIYNGLIISTKVTETTDSTGLAVLDLFPNQIGSQSSNYSIQITHKGKKHRYTAVIPNADCDLAICLSMPTYPGKPDGQLAIEAAIAAAGQSGISAAAAANSAIEAHNSELATSADRAATGADRAQTGLDKTATAADALATSADRAATGADRTQTGLDKAATAADALATSADRAATGADRTQTGLDKAATAADALATSADRVATGADRAQTGLDKAATAADRVQTGLDKASVDGTAVAVAGNAATATTKAAESVSARDQAIVAKDAALAAWVSAMQPAETLPAISKTFHTSTSIVQQIVYDTRQDSDGGQWRKRCQHTSWYKEAISGKWLGEAATAAAAWALAGAVTGAYFHNTTDGKFYTLGAASPAVIETFRGNRREFPEVVAIVAETSKVVIYDMTDPTVPMWMVFAATAAIYWGGATITSVAALNGNVVTGQSSTVGYQHLNFIADYAVGHRNDTIGYYVSGLVNRNGVTSTPKTGYWSAAIVNASVNSVAMTVLPDAPTDMATGLPIPTIAVGTAGGVSVIKHDGTVVNITEVAGAGSAYQTVTDVLFVGARLVFQMDASTSIRRQVFFKDAPFSAGTVNVSTPYSYERFISNLGSVSSGAAPSLMIGADAFMKATKFSKNGIGVSFIGSNNGLMPYRCNQADMRKGMVAAITNAYNSGWQVGDSRGAWLADTVAETVSAPELVTNGTFTVDTTGWAAPFQSSIASVAGQLVVTSTGTNPYAVQYSIPTVVGKTYNLTFDAIAKSAGVSALTAYLGSTNGLAQSQYGSVNFTSLGSGYTVKFVATTAVLCLQFSASCGIGDTFTIDNISVKEVAADRSVKNNGLNIVGSLTKSAVATGSQLMAWSGFNSANYLEQPYSANLDFGTGDFCVSFWVNPSVASQNATILTRSPAALSGNAFALNLVNGVVQLGRSLAGAAFTNTTFGYTLPVGQWTLMNLARVSGVMQLRVNGVQQATTIEDTNNYTNTTAAFTVGVDYTHANPFQGSLALLRSSATPASTEQGQFRYETERKLFEPGAQCLIDGTSSGVTAVAADEVTGLLHVGTSWGRSTFKDLVRVESEATTNGAAKSYSVYDNQLIQAGATGSKVSVPAKQVRDELQRAAEQAAILGLKPQPVDFTATAGQTAFKLPMGIKPIGEVMKNGTSLRATTSYILSFDGFCWTVNLVAAAALNDWVQVMCVRENKLW
ncbi:hypothetical protein OYT1_ch1581 [Ferriphaselus amnicola]|uniref:Uncharacterized protein n=1 Tax=Ferriphaselus amnicola TaxID=1188319 RepID=A0A2Z6GC94_9PROT|nr:LamG domain-containing protein [Ferriphaselus amnicola]BBE51128.1 hypothetical protein OYT1_ch1581 [Ferriphaselus amnicola]